MRGGARGALPALLLALVLALAAAPEAPAHATLQATSPERGSRLAEAPRTVALRFDEPVEASFGAVRVFDREGRRVEVRTRASGARVTAALPSGLADGAYTVTYRVLSADSHLVSGGFVFSVGDPGGAAGASPTVAELLDREDRAGPVTRTSLGAARAVQYGAIALGLGAAIFLLAVWRPAAGPAAPRAFEPALRRVLDGAAGAGLAAGLAGIALQGAVAGGTSLWSAATPSVVGEVLGTRFGAVWGAGVLAWAAVLLLRRPAWALAPLALLALLPALGGHAGTQSPRGLMLGLNVAHVLAVSAWLGGVAVLLLAVRRATATLAPPDRSRLLAAVVGRFSTLAGAAVALLLLTGVLQAVVEVASFGALLDTGFGRAVLAKAALLVLLLALGAVHRRRVLPRLREAARGGRPPGAAGLLLRRVLRGEAAVFLAVLGVTGALASSAPATAVTAGPFSGAATIGPARAELTVEPAQVGANELHLHLLDRDDGGQYDATRELTVTAALPSRGIAPIALEPLKAGPGHYVVRDAVLGAPGTWTLRIAARVSDFDEHTTRIAVPVR